MSTVGKEPESVENTMDTLWHGQTSLKTRKSQDQDAKNKAAVHSMMDHVMEDVVYDNTKSDQAVVHSFMDHVMDDIAHQNPQKTPPPKNPPNKTDIQQTQSTPVTTNPNKFGVMVSNIRRAFSGGLQNTDEQMSGEQRNVRNKRQSNRARQIKSDDGPQPMKNKRQSRRSREQGKKQGQEPLPVVESGADVGIVASNLVPKSGLADESSSVMGIATSHLVQKGPGSDPPDTQNKKQDAPPKVQNVTIEEDDQMETYHTLHASKGGAGNVDEQEEYQKQVSPFSGKTLQEDPSANTPQREANKGVVLQSGEAESTNQRVTQQKVDVPTIQTNLQMETLKLQNVPSKTKSAELPNQKNKVEPVEKKSSFSFLSLSTVSASTAILEQPPEKTSSKKDQQNVPQKVPEKVPSMKSQASSKKGAEILEKKTSSKKIVFANPRASSRKFIKQNSKSENEQKAAQKTPQYIPLEVIQSSSAPINTEKEQKNTPEKNTQKIPTKKENDQKIMEKTPEKVPSKKEEKIILNQKDNQKSENQKPQNENINITQKQEKEKPIILEGTDSGVVDPSPEPVDSYNLPLVETVQLQTENSKLSNFTDNLSQDNKKIEDLEKFQEVEQEQDNFKRFESTGTSDLRSTEQDTETLRKDDVEVGTEVAQSAPPKVKTTEKKKKGSKKKNDQNDTVYFCGCFW